MKNWQQMKEISYVGIKLTKAKSISEGLNRCKIQKLSRNNPVYQHIKCHQKFKEMKQCPICLMVVNKNGLSNRECERELMKSQRRDNNLSRICKTQVFCEQKNNQIHQKKRGSSQLLKKIFYQTPRDKINNELNNFNNVLDRFKDKIKKAKTTYIKIKNHGQNIDRYFITELRQLQLQLDEDKGLSINEVKGYQKIARQSFQKQHMKLLKNNIIVKQLNKPIQFPLTQRQTIKVIENDKLKKQNASRKLNRIVTSIYDYKSNVNYSNRMKMIKAVINK